MIRDLVVIFNNYEESLYLVGGYVRDLLLKRTSNDLDFTTSCLPEKMIQIAKENQLEIDTCSVQYGTIIFKFENKILEVTTYRKDIGTKDNRRPTKIEYCDDLKTDLLRRDFTINSLCYDLINEKFIDLLDGRKDIENRLIRAIGNPQVRIDEDYLRIIRAYRFKYALNFKFETELNEVLKTSLAKLEYIADERIRDELLKIFLINDETSFLVIKDLFDYFEFRINEAAILRLKKLKLSKEKYLYTLLLLLGNLDLSLKYNFIKKSNLNLRRLALNLELDLLKTSIGELYQLNKRCKLDILCYYHYSITANDEYLHLLEVYKDQTHKFKLNFNATCLKDYGIEQAQYRYYLEQLEVAVINKLIINDSTAITDYLKLILAKKK